MSTFAYHIHTLVRSQANSKSCILFYMQGDSSQGRREAYLFGIREVGDALFWRNGGGRHFTHFPYPPHTHARTHTHTKMRLLKCVSGSQISTFSSTMVNVWLWNNKVKLGYSSTFQKVRFQNFPQPWENKTVRLCYFEACQQVKFRNFLPPWWKYDYEIKQ